MSSAADLIPSSQIPNQTYVSRLVISEKLPAASNSRPRHPPHHATNEPSSKQVPVFISRPFPLHIDEHQSRLREGLGRDRIFPSIPMRRQSKNTPNKAEWASSLPFSSSLNRPGWSWLWRGLEDGLGDLTCWRG